MPSPREGGEKVPEGRMRGLAALKQHGDANGFRRVVR